MDLIFYYPFEGGAPSTVARNIFKYLLKKRGELPFENIKLFVSPKYMKCKQKYFSDYDMLTYRNLRDISRNSIIHIPTTILIYPNSKFFLHLFAVLKRHKLILQYHGDLRTEMQLKLKYEHSLDVSYLPSYIAVPQILRSADKLIVNSFLMEKLIRSKYGVKNEVVIPNGIEDFWFDESAETNIELEGEPSIFYHGRLSPEKGVDLLIKGFAEGTGDRKKARLYIAADGLQRDYLENLCIKLGIEKKVIFLRYINQKDIKTYLSNSNVAIYPSRFDSFSLGILEALSSANCPVYFSKRAGINDFVIREGYKLNTFEPTVGNICKTIKEIVRGNYDRGIEKQQKEFAKKYRWDNIIGYYIEMYYKLISVL